MNVTNPDIRFDFASENWLVRCDVDLMTPDKDPSSMKLQVSFQASSLPPTNPTAFTWWLRERFEERFGSNS